MKERGEKKEESEQDWTFLMGLPFSWELKQEPDPNIRAIIWDRGEEFESFGE